VRVGGMGWGKAFGKTVTVDLKEKLV